MHSLPPVILLDLDDTILRFSAVADDCWSHACTTFAPRLQSVDPTILMANIKQHAQWYWSDAERGRRGRLDLVTARRLIVRDALAAFQAGADHIADALADAYRVMRDELVQPFPGAIETLSELRRRGVHPMPFDFADATLRVNGRGEMHKARSCFDKPVLSLSKGSARTAFGLWSIHLQIALKSAG